LGQPLPQPQQLALAPGGPFLQAVQAVHVSGQRSVQLQPMQVYMTSGLGDSGYLPLLLGQQASGQPAPSLSFSGSLNGLAVQVSTHSRVFPIHVHRASVSRMARMTQRMCVCAGLAVLQADLSTISTPQAIWAQPLGANHWAAMPAASAGAGAGPAPTGTVGGAAAAATASVMAAASGGQPQPGTPAPAATLSLLPMPSPAAPVLGSASSAAATGPSSSAPAIVSAEVSGALAFLQFLTVLVAAAPL
jgi:hypothetical protein